jgi:hypothetical protein
LIAALRFAILWVFEGEDIRMAEAQTHVFHVSRELADRKSRAGYAMGSEV